MYDEDVILSFQLHYLASQLLRMVCTSLTRLASLVLAFGSLRAFAFTQSANTNVSFNFVILQVDYSNRRRNSTRLQRELLIRYSWFVQ